jgi:hypothetical protein
MKFFIFLFSWIFFINCSGQENLSKLLDETCICLYNVTINANEKTMFNSQYSNCIEQFNIKIIEMDSSYIDINKQSNLFHTEFKRICPHYNIIDSLFEYYTTIKNTDFIISASDCEIMKNGTFRTLDYLDSTLIIYNDSIQTVKFTDGSYTISTITWDTPCSYYLTRVESTNWYESQMRKPGDITGVRIIKVENKSVSFEMDIKGRTFTGTLIKNEN